ncbi:murein transglycosylase A [Parvularcula dongshanensis]|uniref:murein transglycosylase A n=1 Tax=Parvularcula dongshanensis TaxID=1173995 RepID=UPI001C87C5A0|nr:murein transglycosylase A [Parvularcula dongshanensis]
MLALAACGREAGPFELRAARFSDLPGWNADAVEAALPAFRRSCAAMAGRSDDAAMNPLERLGHEDVPTLSGTVADWREACLAAEALREAPSPAAARSFFEMQFTPVEVRADGSLFTGYFEPSYPARAQAQAPYTAPVLTRPPDLLTADLGAFKEDLQGQDIVGRVEGDRFVPYPDAETIAADPPEGAEALAYIDPNDLLFLQIQGSGRLVFEDGSVLRAGYAAKNGRAYVAVGRTLVRDGAMALEDVSMQSIMAWLRSASPEDAARVRHSNPSYVFFRPLTLADDALGPLGAQGVQLTPGRSLAVDRRFHAMGAPVFLATERTEENPAYARLMVAQDTGGAIRGPVRGDVFFGAGEAAAEAAGTMNAEGRLFVLLPQRLAARLLDAQV